MMPLRGRSLTEGVLNREKGLWGTRFGTSQQLQQYELLDCISFDATETAIPLPPATETAGAPLCAQFNKNSSLNNRNLLAVGGEEGFITIVSAENLDTLQRDVLDGSWRPRAHWPCHRNSVFDLAWAKNDSVIYTASGHQQVGIWDTDTARGLAVAQGHEGSVKSVAPLHLCEDVFATGSRDGRIMLWDARCPGFSGQAATGSRRALTGTGLDGAPVLSPVWTQEGAHSRPSATAGRASSKTAKAAPVTVTSVAFVPYSYLLLSGGANDAVVKLWDLRMHGLPMCDMELPTPVAGTSQHAGRVRGKHATADSTRPGVPHEVAAYSCPTRASAVGVTHIAVSESGDRLLVSCLDSQYHLFSLNRLAAGPITTWCAPPPALKSTFYMRSAFSPCGGYVLSGSRDCGAHIWSVTDPQRPPIALPHTHEVTGVAWCGGDWSKVATCSDSNEVRVWNLNRMPARAVVADADAAAALGTGRVEVDEPAVAAAQHGLSAAPLSKGDVAVHAIGAAVSSPAAARRAPITPATNRPTGRRMVQLRLNLSRTPRETTPAPAPPAASAVTPVQDAPAAATPPSGLPPAAISAFATAAATGALDSETIKESATPPAVPTPDHEARAAAVRASALMSPVSAAPAQPASRRRSGPLPPVPIFSPAVNRWQPRDPQPSASPAAAPQPAASRPVAAAVPLAVYACGGLEAAMKALPQVRTQSPSHQSQRDDDPQLLDLQPQRLTEQQFMGANVTGREAHNAASEDVWLFRRPSVGEKLPSADQAAAAPAAIALAVFPAPNSALLAARIPAASPKGTPTTSFQRSRSRLGFSPSYSSHSSGSAPSSGGGSTPRQHQPPQGVVAQILRNSPRPGGRAAGLESLSSLPVPSPRNRGGSPRLEAHASAPVGRRLFSVPEERQEQVPPPLPQPDGWVAGHGSHLANGAFGWNVDAAPGAGAGSNVVASIGQLLQRPGSPIGGQGSQRELANLMYDVEDGQEVAPALRHRALHPDDSRPFSCIAHGGDESDGDEESDRRISDGGENDGGMAPPSAPSERRRPRTSTSRAESPPRGIAPVPLLGWEDDAAGPREAAPGGADDLFAGWALRRLDSGNMCLVEGRGAQPFSDDDSDWECDPYGDKENTPPPEPLEGVPAEPLASGTGDGGSAPTAPASGSPLLAAEPEHSLPRLLESADPVASARSMPPRQGGTAATPFAAALPFPEAAAPDFAVGGFRAAPAPSLHSVPSVSAGMGLGPNAGNTGSGVVEMPSFGLDCLLPARYNSAASSEHGMGDESDDRLAEVSQPPMATPQRHGGSCGRRCHPGNTDGAAEVDAVPERRKSENPSPPKRARKAYIDSDDEEEYLASLAGRRSPSPPRSVRPPRVPSCAMPTPMRSQRPISSMAMPSPCVRSGRRPGCGVSRLAEVGFMGAVSAASASIGSESPAPKIGTASRTGRRDTAASEEFFRRRADEDREGTMMSPFGFGELPGFAAPPQAAPASERGGGPDRRGTSRLARGCGIGDMAAVATGQLLFSEGVASDDMANARAEASRREVVEEEEEFRAIQGSVRSLSCVFETQHTETQGGSTMMVPCTYPNEEGAEELDDNDEQQRRYGAPLPLLFEERTVASPALFGMAAAGGYDANGGGASRGGDMEGQASIGFGRLFGHTQQQHPLYDYQQHRRSSATGQAVPTQGLLDESSRCFPVAGLGASGPAQGLDVLTMGWAGGNGSVPLAADRRPQQGLLSSFAGVATVEPLPSPAGGAAGTQPQLQSQQLLPGAMARKHKQQTLRQCWGGAVPLQGPSSGYDFPAHVPISAPRPLGPTGLASPRYFR